MQKTTKPFNKKSAAIRAKPMRACAVCGTMFGFWKLRESRARFCSIACSSVRTPEQIEERFFSHVERIPEAGCWIFNCGAPIGAGYSSFGIGGKTHRAHRWSYEHFVGEIPAGMVVRHSCDVPACVNPKHLLIGTSQDNALDKSARGRDAKGSGHGNAKLNEEMVKEILMKLETYKLGMYVELAKKYDVSISSISKIHRNLTWKHVEAARRGNRA